VPNYEVSLKSVSPQLIVSRTITIPTNEEVPAYLDEAYREVYRHIEEQGAKVTGPRLAIWNQPATVLVGEVVEVAVPVDHLVSSSNRLKVYELPQAAVASSVHHGNFENFKQLHATLLSWIETNNYLIVGSYREIYMNPVKSAKSATEVQYPVVKTLKPEHSTGR
jgi:effector-binding domain-containing protein